jgi:hypothetical protein
MAELTKGSTDLDVLSEFFKIRQRRLRAEFEAKEARTELHMPQLELLEIPGLNLTMTFADEDDGGGGDE